MTGMPERPNILVFLTDDHGQWASTPYGNRELLTPNLEYLARRGTRMANCFAPSPVCSPARASFWTGQIPSRHGIHDYLQEPGESSRDHPALKGQRTLGEMLRDAGYRVGLCGKWHCGHPGEPREGFDTWFTSLRGTNARFGKQVFIDGSSEVAWRGHQAPPVTERALRFLREEDSRPWFLFVGYTDTHTPHTGAPQRLAQYYREHADFRDIPNEPTTTSHGAARMEYSYARERKREELCQYYAAVTFIDEQIGRILDELESLGELENTLIVYTGDHGHMNGHHGLATKGNATVPGNLLEESIRVHGLISLPGLLPENAALDELCDLCDIHATARDAAGAPQDEGEAPGRSLLPIARGEAPGKETQFSEYGVVRMARSRRHKLIVHYPARVGEYPPELYDLREDPDEERNVYDLSEYSDIAADLKARLESFFERWEDPQQAGTLADKLPRHSEHEPWKKNPANPKAPVS